MGCTQYGALLSIEYQSTDIYQHRYSDCVLFFLYKIVYIKML